MYVLNADSKTILLNKLSEIDITVSPRAQGRTTPETERWSICRLMSTLGNIGRLAFPLTLEKCERPDYLLSQLGKKTIGIEVTEVVHQEYIQTQMLPEARLVTSIVDRSLFRQSGRRMTLAKRREIAGRTSLSGPGWQGDEPEREFADAIRARILAKSQKLNEATYGRFDEDWLLIYENLFLPDLKRLVASNHLHDALRDYWDKNSFLRVFVESGSSLIEFTASDIKSHRIHNVW